MIITEIKGNAHVFTLSDGETFRIFPRQVKEEPESRISDEMRIAEKMGLILLTPSTKKVSTVSKNTTNKDGGKK